MPGNARHMEDLNHLHKDNKYFDENLNVHLPVPHLIKWLDNREVSFNSERDSQVDTASHGTLEKTDEIEYEKYYGKLACAIGRL